MRTETLPGRMIDHPKRPWIVIILSFVIGLATILPAADEYLALSEQHAQLEGDLAATRARVANLTGLEGESARQLQSLRALESRMVPSGKVQQLQADLVAWCREAGCRLQGIRIDQPRSRKWHENDRPLATRVLTDAGKETSFELNTQVLSVTLTGTQSCVNGLLSRLHADNRLIHTKAIAMRPEKAGRRDVHLEMSLMLFDLTEAILTEEL